MSIKKIILVLIFPCVWLFHPKLRNLEKAKIKYWEADGKYFKEELNFISLSLIASVLLYFLVFQGLGHIVGTVRLAAYEAQSNYGDTIDKYEAKTSTHVRDRSEFNTDVVQKPETVVIKEEEYKEHEEKDKVVHKEVMEEEEDEFQKLLKQQQALHDK